MHLKLLLRYFSFNKKRLLALLPLKIFQFV